LAKILLNKANFFHNLDICSKQAGGKDKISIVLKDNAYGHGLLEIAQISKEYGITKAVVRTLKEAQEIENYFKEILILADTKSSSLAHSFHITVNSLEDLNKIGASSNIAIKVDTGMHRNGIAPDELEACIYKAFENNLIIKSIFTHHRSADILSSEYFWQEEQFKALKAEAIRICAKLKLPTISFHSSNSSALFRDNNFNDDYCRIGIAAYGYLESEKPLNIPNLKPVLSLVANKISTRILKQNESIGYGATYTADKDMVVSTYDIGYADGFLRIDPNTPFYTKDGSQLLGRVSMDNISINSDKDELCLFDDVTQLSKIHNTISYEILTCLSKDLKRSIV
jgi:alanine racemase